MLSLAIFSLSYLVGSNGVPKYLGQWQPAIFTYPSVLP